MKSIQKISLENIQFFFEVYRLPAAKKILNHLLWAEQNKRLMKTITKKYNELPAYWQTYFRTLLKNKSPLDALKLTLQVKELLEKAQKGTKIKTVKGLTCEIKKAANTKYLDLLVDSLLSCVVDSTPKTRELIKESFAQHTLVFAFRIDGRSFGVVYAGATGILKDEPDVLRIIRRIKNHQQLPPSVGWVFLDDKLFSTESLEGKLIIQAIKEGVTPDIAAVIT